MQVAWAFAGGVAAGLLAAALILAGRYLPRARRSETLAVRDAKTGLLSAAAWEAAAARALTEARREHAPAAVLMIDVDDFKAVNDRSGHLAGDAVLVALATCLTA